MKHCRSLEKAARVIEKSEKRAKKVKQHLSKILQKY
jgi:hypothetical protein